MSVIQSLNNVVQALNSQQQQQVNNGVSNYVVPAINSAQNAVLPSLSPKQRHKVAMKSIDLLTEHTGDMFKDAFNKTADAFKNYQSGALSKRGLNAQINQIASDLHDDMTSSINQGAFKVLGKNISTHATLDVGPALQQACVSSVQAFMNFSQTGSTADFAREIGVMANDFLVQAGIR